MLCQFCECDQPVPSHRRKFCSDTCASRQRNRAHDHKRARLSVFLRDLGACGLCGSDTARLRAAHIRRLLADFPGFIPDLADQLHPELRPAGFPSLRHSWWQADHHVPLIEGGDSSLENYRTLCVPCHKIETRRLQCRRAETRRAGGTLELHLG